MRVLGTERGERPDIWTKARVIAPQASEYLGKLLEQETFADSAVIVLDWLGDMAWNGEGDMPQELRTPAMVVVTEKWYPQVQRRLRLDYVFDLNDLFGQDNATKDDLHAIVENLRTKAREEEAKRGI